MRNFDITGMMGFWYIVQYYASSEELPEYGCMRCVLSMSPQDYHVCLNHFNVFTIINSFRVVLRAVNCSRLQ